MKFQISHRVLGRTRFSSEYRFNYERANNLKCLIESIDGVYYAKVSTCSGSVIVEYEEYALSSVCKLLLDTSLVDLDRVEIEDTSYIPLEEKELFHIVRDAFEVRFVMKNFFPAPLGMVVTLIRASRFMKAGLTALYHRKLNVEVLDASAIGISLGTNDFAAASSIMFLLNLGEKLEDWTLK